MSAVTVGDPGPHKRAPPDASPSCLEALKSLAEVEERGRSRSNLATPIEIRVCFNVSGLSFADRQALQSSTGRRVFQPCHENPRKPAHIAPAGISLWATCIFLKRPVLLHINVFKMSLHHICCSSSSARPHALIKLLSYSVQPRKQPNFKKKKKKIINKERNLPRCLELKYKLQRNVAGQLPYYAQCNYFLVFPRISPVDTPLHAALILTCNFITISSTECTLRHWEQLEPPASCTHARDTARLLRFNAVK